MSVDLSTQRLHFSSAAKVHHFLAFVCPHRTKRLWCKHEPVCQFLQHSGTHHDDDVYVFFSNVFPRRLPVNLNLHLLTITSHYNSIHMIINWDPDPPNTLESDKGMFFCCTLHNYKITIRKQDLYDFTVLVRRADRHSDFFFLRQ